MTNLCDEIRNIARDAPMSAGTRTRLHAIAHDFERLQKELDTVTQQRDEWRQSHGEISGRLMSLEREARGEAPILPKFLRGSSEPSEQRCEDRLTLNDVVWRCTKPANHRDHDRQPVATPGATLTGEDSVSLSAESSRPRELLASEAASFDKTLARSPRRIIPARDADHCDYPDCEQHWTHVVAQARALLEPLTDCDPAIRQWLKTPDLPKLQGASRDASSTGCSLPPTQHVAGGWGYSCTEAVRCSHGKVDGECLVIPCAHYGQKT